MSEELPRAGRIQAGAAGAALRGGLVAGTILIGVMAARGTIDAWFMGAAILAIAASGLAAGRPRRGSPGPNRPAATERRLAVADALLANIPDPVILVDRRALVIEANEAAHALLPNLKARQPLSFALRAPDVLDGVERSLKTGEVLKVEYSERIPTERTFEVQIGTLRMAEDSSNGPPNVVLFFRDLTAARRLEHMRVDFVANASHELRTPLASLLGFIETLQGSARNDAGARDRFLEIMRGQAQRMTRLIDDLLSLSRIELREHVAPDTPLDLLLIVQHMRDSLGPLARERGLELTLAPSPGPHMVLGDRDELLRVAENLIENAVKYGESGGRVDLALERLPASGGQPSQFELCVRDYGPGIAPEHLPRLTERFYRVDVAESRQKGGTGLGLAIVKHIVHRHGGRLLIESTPGEGARFRVMLPEYAPR
jgi:two-component system phosphate regulon sensor histidine kinase PhoR